MALEISSVRVAILSDDRLFIDGLFRLVRDETSLSIVEHIPSTSHPRGLPERMPDVDVVLVDSRMPNALAVCSARREHGPAVIFVAAPAEDRWGIDALSFGARGVLPKTAGASDLIKAIAVVHAGLIWAPRRILVACIDLLQRADSSAASRRSAGLVEQRLSVREREVLRFAAAGLGNKELACRLAISEATVKVHLTSIFRKIGVRGRGELAAAYHGILHPSAGSSPAGVRQTA